MLCKMDLARCICGASLEVLLSITQYPSSFSHLHSAVTGNLWSAVFLFTDDKADLIILLLTYGTEEVTEEAVLLTV